MAKKLIFGLKNVKYSIYTEGENGAAGTYGPVKSLTEGAVSLTADVQANSTDFYADDAVYAVINSVTKETGSIEIAYLTEDVKKDLFGYVTDETSGLTYVTTEPKTITVALLYETSGNMGKMRGVRYNVQFTMPNEAANTQTESTNPDTVTLNYSATGRDFTIGGETKNVLKAHVLESEADAYRNFYTRVLVPGVSSATA